MIDPGPWIQWGGLVLAVLAFAAAFAVPRLLRALRKRGAPEPDAKPAEPREVLPLCDYCDALPVRAPSHFVGAEGLGAELRVRFGAAQSYAPRIATDEPPRLCLAHARTWDALLSERVATTIARERAEAEVRIAREMAAFESEGLHEAMIASLTDAQRTALRKRKQPAAPVRALKAVNGADEGGSGEA